MRAWYLEKLNQDMLNTHGTEVFKTDYMNCSLYLYHFMTVLWHMYRREKIKRFIIVSHITKDKDEH